MKKRILLTIALTSIVAVLVVFFSSALVFYSQLLDNTETLVQNEATLLANQLNTTDTALQGLIPTENFRVTLIEDNGTVVYDTCRDCVLENHLDRPEVQQALETGAGRSLRESKSLSTQMFYYAVVLTDGQILRVSTTTASFFGVLTKSMGIMVLVVAFVLCICVALATWQTQKIVDPINHLNLQVPLSNKTYPELEPLLKNLELHNKMKREFSANVSHELKTPLTSISGYAEIMANGLVKPEDTPAFSQKIYDESQNLIGKINDIIKISRLDEQKIELDFEIVDYADLIRMVLSSLQPLAYRKEVTLNDRLQEVKGLAIPSIFQDMISNLISNAIKYNHPHGQVLVTLEKKKTNVVIQVVDTGEGIPEEDLPRIYERFYRGDKAHSSEKEGSGLGLALVKHAVVLHQGTIACSSVVGQGTTFTLTLPTEPVLPKESDK